MITIASSRKEAEIVITTVSGRKEAAIVREIAASRAANELLADSNTLRRGGESAVGE